MSGGNVVSGEGLSRGNRWPGMRMLETVHRLNGQCVALLAGLAREGAPAQIPTAALASRELWARVDEAACRRAASCPVLLLDLKFQDPLWWAEIRDENADLARDSGAIRPFAVPLREVLLEAWSQARVMPRALSFPFGIAPEVARVMSHLTAADLERILHRHAGHACPRWPQNRKFWDMLLVAALSSEEEALEHVKLYSLQLLGREFLKTHH
jgi:hypothetical protein